MSESDPTDFDGWQECGDMFCHVWNQCMNKDICQMTTWIDDPEFGLVPLKEYERLQNNRKKGKNKNYKSGMTITKTTPIAEEVPVAAPAHPASVVREINELRVQMRNSARAALAAKREAEKEAENSGCNAN